MTESRREVRDRIKKRLRAELEDLESGQRKEELILMLELINSYEREGMLGRAAEPSLEGLEGCNEP